MIVNTMFAQKLGNPDIHVVYKTFKALNKVICTFLGCVNDEWIPKGPQEHD